ncbi:hypothetical protein [Methanoregula sp.]|uniref:hypothetical protein n=1 Tax=Methanoregula sp. TaxID=2052170 RepID=UPI0025D6D286|nr:hypothetical protein [Methanoregula sp.]
MSSVWFGFTASRIEEGQPASPGSPAGVHPLREPGDPGTPGAADSPALTDEEKE